MDHKTMNTGGDTVMDDHMTNPGGSTTMNGTTANNTGNTTMNGTTPDNGRKTSTNGSSTLGNMAKTSGGIAQGVLWLGATALALVGAKYAWQRAQQSLKNTNVDPKYIETAEKMVDSVVDGTLRH